MNPAEEYIHNAPEPYRGILMHVQAVIEASFPKLQLKFKWKLPFYYLDDTTMFCFLNFRKKFVDVGLPYGVHLKNEEGILLDGEKRKMLRSIRYRTLAEIDDELLIKTLRELKKFRAV